MKKILLVLCLFASLLRADESAPSPCGKRFLIKGEITHYKTPSDVTIAGAKNEQDFAEEVYGHSFSAVVEGLPAGVYSVEIDLAEVFHKAAGERIMRITCGSTVLADHLDIYAVAGFDKDYCVRGQIRHSADAIGGPLTIEFTAIKGEAKFNAIHILDSQGKGVACVKAVDLVNVGDFGASKIPQVSAPVIYTDPDKPMDARIDDLIRRMSLSEKVNQLCNAAPAIPRLNVPQYNYWSECLHGVARNGHATVFPQAIGMAAAWDEDLMHRIGEVIATEARAKYNDDIRHGWRGQNCGLTFWAPNVNIFRDPRWGRGQETYGEDTYLTSRLAVGFITGIQGNNPKYLEAMACAKHFAVHSGPEAIRFGFNVNPTPRDLYEVYLPQFQVAVQEAHVGSVMASYNAIDGVPNACNRWLLTDLLRKTWGFQGHVVSDCGAVAHIYDAHHYAPSREAGAALALKAGLDLNCGGTFRELVKAIHEGLATEKDVDIALHRVLKARFQLGLFDPPSMVPFSNVPMTEVESPAHLKLARMAACESMVLLQNNGILPLDKTKLKRIAVIGSNANSNSMLLGNYNGTPTTPINILKGIKDEVGSLAQVDFTSGCPLITRKNEPPVENTPEFQKAVKMANSADVVIYVGGLNADMEGEESGFVAPGFFHGDRTTIELPKSQEKMLQALQATGKPVIFVNCSGSAIAMPWEAAHLAAIVQAWYPGGQGGAAVADVLFGKYNPSGRLPITFYEKTSDLPGFSDYRMENRTYRYFHGKALFPFGFGLSYTSFEYLPPSSSAVSLTQKGTLHLRVPVKNTGTRNGDEVVQIYLKDKDSPVPQPVRSLIAFKRVQIAKGATVNVDFDIPVARFHYWSTAKKAYVVAPGNYDIEIGASSSDIRQVCRVKITQS